MKHLTDTTGTEEGVSEVRAFISMANSKFLNVDIQPLQGSEIPAAADFLQYTLLTGNRIRIYLSMK